MSSKPARESANRPAEPSPSVSVEEIYRQLEVKVRKIQPRLDTSELEKAYRFAAEHHSPQTRESGEPFMVHPLTVTHILADMNMDMVSLQTGLLHDVVEDTSATLADVRQVFGDEVARCVDGVTHLSKVDFFSAEARQAESMRKMLLAMVKDLRVIIVKLADRIHNMSTLGYLPRAKQLRIARETMDIYAPIAHRLGMGKVRGQLADLAFSFLEPEAYASIVKEIETTRRANDPFLNQIRRTVEGELRKEGISATVDGRLKHPSSVYEKMRRQKIGIEQVYDLLAIRIITDSVKSCYAALGVIHNKWHPVPGRIKDFIAMPRPNLYQSLHTSVIGPGGHPFEVQIRTHEMHNLAEEGIAAHWKYKEGRKGVAEDDQHIAWLRQLVEWQRDMRDSGEFMSTLKVDLYHDEVYTFTPRGRVIVLPSESTPIDFAYAIHTDVGNGCVGAKINGRIVPLKYNLRNGDVVEILTQAGHMPSKDWLALVRTSRARNKIKHIINVSERAKALDIGQKYLEKEARRLGVKLSKVSKGELAGTASEYGYGRVDDLYAALGYGKVSPRKILQKLLPQSAEPDSTEAEVLPKGTRKTGAPSEAGDLVIKVKGMDDLMVYRAKCCNPIRGEAIVGYITRGKGVAVHSDSCPNVQSLMYEVERRIEVEWARASKDWFPVKMVVYTDNRPGMLAHVTSILFKEEINIRSLEARSDEDDAGDGALVDMIVDVRDKKQLEKIVTAMRRTAGVRDVKRI